MTDWENRTPIQVVCNDDGDTNYVTPTYLPIAGEYRAVCPCDCGAAEYREPGAIEA